MELARIHQRRNAVIHSDPTHLGEMMADECKNLDALRLWWEYNVVHHCTAWHAPLRWEGFHELELKQADHVEWLLRSIYSLMFDNDEEEPDDPFAREDDGKTYTLEIEEVRVDVNNALHEYMTSNDNDLDWDKLNFPVFAADWQKLEDPNHCFPFGDTLERMLYVFIKYQEKDIEENKDKMKKDGLLKKCSDRLKQSRNLMKKSRDKVTEYQESANSLARELHYSDFEHAGPINLARTSEIRRNPRRFVNIVRKARKERDALTLYNEREAKFRKY